MLLQKAVFLDKDGTLIENIPYNVDTSKIRFNEGVLEGLQKLHQAGYKLIVISNQAGVARGLFKEEDLVPVHEHLRCAMEAAGVPLAGFSYCPHHPEGRVPGYNQRCFCRKPSPGLLFQAAREHNLNLSASWMIGDILNDIEAGRRAECRTVLLDHGNETEWMLSPLRQPHFSVKNFAEAVEVILAADRPVEVQADRKEARKPARGKPTSSGLPVNA